MPNELLPTNIGFGTVVGRFGSAPLVAGDADGLPDFSPAAGLTVTFTPSTAAVIDATASPAPVTIEMVPIVCGLDTQGYLVGGDGQRGVKLIATNDTDINPSGWTYSVTFLRAGAKVAAFRDFSMSLPAGVTKDIALTIPVPSSEGVSLSQAQAAEAAAVSAASAAAASAAAAAASTALFSVDNLPQAGTTGKALAKASDTATAQTAIGATAVGKALVTAADTSAAQTAIGATTTGKALVAAADATAGRTALSAVGKGDLLVNVKDYGVMGNGIADDGPALRTLFASAVNGVTYYFPSGSYRIRSAVGGVCAAITGKSNVTLRGLGRGASLVFENVTATDGIRIDGCRDFTMKDIAITITGSTRLRNAVHHTCPIGGGAHNGRFDNVNVSNPTKAYRPLYDLSTTADSPVVTSGSGAFSSGDIGGAFGIIQAADVLVGRVISVATRTATLAADITSTSNVVTLDAPIPNAPNAPYTVMIDSDLLYVTSGFQTSTLSVARLSTLGGVLTRAAHTAGAVVTTYQATLDINMLSTTTSTAFGGHLQTPGAAVLENAFAVGTDHFTGAMDIAQTTFTGCNAEYVIGCGWRLGPGIGGNILNITHLACQIAVGTVGVFMNGAVMNWYGPGVGSNGCDFKMGAGATQPVVIAGVRSEESGMFWDTSGAGTSGSVPVSIRDSRHIASHTIDGTIIRHQISQPLLLDAVILLRDVDNLTITINASGTSGSPLYYTARGVATNAGNNPHPPASTAVVRNIQAGNRIVNNQALRSLHGSAIDQGLTLNSALIQTTKQQTLSSNGAVTIDASAGDAVITLAANATSSTITNPIADQLLRITWVQNATGGRTYVWPTSCKFAGGTAPSDTTASKETTVVFRCDSTATVWREVSRAVAVG